MIWIIVMDLGMDEMYQSTMVWKSQESGRNLSKLGHTLIGSLIHWHLSLIHLLSTVCFARAPRCVHLFACSLTHSPLGLWELGSG